MSNSTLQRLVYVVAATVTLGIPAWGAPVETAFAYQGQLKDGGVPPTGEYDMCFSLFNATSGGTHVAGPLCFDGGGDRPPVEVVNGLFHVPLDFGEVFDGTALWLHVDVRPHAIGNYAQLTPRQPITATPFALYALDGPGQAGFWAANGNSIYKTNSGNVGIGATDPEANLEVRSSSFPRLRVAKIHTGGFGVNAPAVLELKSNFTGTDQPYGKVNFLDGNDTVQGSIEYGANPAGLLAPVSLRLGTAGQTRLTITDTGNVGIGTAAPGYSLDVVGRSRIQQASGGSTAGLWFYQAGPAEDRGFIGMRNDNQLGLWGSEGIGWGMVMDVANGNVGIGITNPLTKLHVSGGSDTAPGGGGFIVTGDISGANISIDNNEIMARNNGTTSPLYLNANGGDVVVGGAIDIGYQIVWSQDCEEGIQSAWTNVFCPAGSHVIGGGCTSGSAARDIAGSEPIGTTGWHCSITSASCDPPPKSYAICARVK